MTTRMQQRRGTAAQWTSGNPVLAAGEIGFATDLGKFKVGNGTSTWSNLKYFTDAESALESVLGGISGTDLPAALDTLNEISAALNDDPAFFTTIATNLSNHAADTTDIHGITNTADLVTTTILSNHNTSTSNVHGIADTLVLATLSGTQTLTNKTLVTPLGIVKGDVGLGSVDNTTDLNKAVSTATQTALNLKANLASPTFTGTVTLPTGTVTAGMILDGTIIDADINASAEIAQSKISGLGTALGLKAPLADPTFTGTVNGVTKSHVGLGNVDNTSDANKPVSTATQTALDLKLASATAATTYAPLASPALTGVPTAPTAAAATNTTQVATTAYVRGEVAALVNSAGATLDTLGEIATALGNDANLSTTLTNAIALKAPLASPTFTGTVSGITKSMVGLGSVDNTADSAKPVSTATQTALDLKLASATAATTYAPLNAPTFTGTVSGITSTMVGLGNVANTADANKPVSTATQTALDLKLASATAATTYAPLASPTFTGTVTVAASGVAFTDGTQTKEGVPSRTPIIQKTAGYTLSVLSERDSLIEVSSATGVTVTIPTNATTAFPIGSSIDILQTGAGQVTIAGAAGVTVNATPGLKLRTQWSTATLMKRATDSWIVVGDLTA